MYVICIYLFVQQLWLTPCLATNNHRLMIALIDRFIERLIRLRDVYRRNQPPPPSQPQQEVSSTVSDEVVEISSEEDEEEEQEEEEQQIDAVDT